MRYTWILAVLVLFFTGDRLAGLVLEQIADKSQFRYSRLYSGKASAATLLVGNSRGLCLYQPYIEEKTGKSTFNISYNGMPINLARALVEDYYEEYPAPEQLLLDVTMCDRINNPLMSGFQYYIGKDSENLSQLIQDSLPKSYWAGQITHLYRYNSEVFQRTLFYLNKSDEGWLIDRVITPEMIEEVDRADAYIWQTPGNLMDDLVKIVKLAESKGTRVELIISPYFPDFAYKFIDFEKWKAEVESRTGKKIKDYSLEFEDPKYFGDFQHLNIPGAVVYIDKMLQDGVLR